MDSKLTLQEQADEILAKAEAKGVESNFFFVTTFERYQVQMKILSELKKEIKDEPIKREYVKGKIKVTPNPVIAEYNRTATAANQTAATLVKIIS